MPSTSELPDSLDRFRRCSAPGCAWQVQSDFPVKCWEHLGPPRPQFVANDDGEFLDYKFMPNADYDVLE